MFNGNGGYSLADIAAATGGNNNDGFGGDGNGWWIILLFLFALGGWGGNGSGFGGRGNSGGGGVADNYILASDFSNIERKLDSVNNGLCDGFYAMNTGMLNGFNGLQTVISSEFRGVDNAICNLGYQTQAGINNVITAGNANTNAIVGQLNTMAAANAACCCETQRQIERGFADTNYNMATQACETRRAITDSTRDIIDSNNAGVRSILDFLTQDKIATLTAENQSLKFAASQAHQNNYLIDQLKPCPVPAYVVANPNCCVPYNPCGLGSYAA